MLWPAHDPLFPRAWADRLDTCFTAATITNLPDAGHFSSLEAPSPTDALNLQMLIEDIRASLRP